MDRIYLDNNATTALDPRVLQAMLPELSGPPANPSSIHYFGKQAKAQLSSARRSIASFFGVDPEELIFTSGATEGLNSLIRGIVNGQGNAHIISSPVEHASVYRTIQVLKDEQTAVTFLPVNSWGAPLPEDLERTIRPHTTAIVLSAANSETGVKTNIEEMARIAQRYEIPLIVDATAIIGKEPFPMPASVSAIAFSGHKFHAPKGIGAIIIRPHVKLTPLLTGGSQEFQRRAGTENLAGILGLAEAFQIIREHQSEITHHLQLLRDHLEQGLLHELSCVAVNGAGPRIPNTSNLAFRGIDGENLLIHLDMAGIAVSHGSSCSAGSLEPSRILLEMGLDRATARSSVRFSVGRTNSRKEIDQCIERVVTIVRKLQN